jgi:hypothetical protein
MSSGGKRRHVGFFTTRDELDEQPHPLRWNHCIRNISRDDRSSGESDGVDLKSGVNIQIVQMDIWNPGSN